ncbi:hypothetical protein FXO38_30685 [Capsicum annuum]|nr:hypothetical protein FXO38_30685 [Capsicum annuum]KAF3656909.1 hypothetical protein FXO37_15239 [Capsicum annuum]
MAEEKSLNVNEELDPKRKHKGKHDKPKPWDDPSIDHWKIEKFDPEWNQSGLLEVSTFSTLFPQYRGELENEGYLHLAHVFWREVKLLSANYRISIPELTSV